MYDRRLNLSGLLAQKSLFLLGPRATGKSFLIRQTLKDQALVIDLLKHDLLLRLSADPDHLEALVAARGAAKWVVIDEVQRAPALLDVVHRLIEETSSRFLLTGSSARKLRRGGANLLAGRAWNAEMFPLVTCEDPAFDLATALRYGGLPSVRSSQRPEEDLAAYTQTYLREEILAEGLIRKLPPFARFLTTMALANGTMLNYAALASDAAVPASTIREYIGILEDTLIGFHLPAWTKSKKRKAVQTAKFYFFDTGVTHALSGTETLDRNSNLWGQSFEQWLACELRAYLSYARLRQPLAYWRSTHGHEVDFLIGTKIAVEAKATKRLDRSDFRGALALREEGIVPRIIIVSEDPNETVQRGIECRHWKTFISEMWGPGLLP